MLNSNKKDQNFDFFKIFSEKFDKNIFINNNSEYNSFNDSNYDEFRARIGKIIYIKKEDIELDMDMANFFD